MVVFNTLYITYTLTIFRWQETATNEYSGIFSGGHWTLQQKDDHIAYKRVPSTNCDEESLRNYLRLDEPLDLYYKEWSLCDPIFKKSAERFKGIRMLKQEPVENILSFICSSNNNIKRLVALILLQFCFTNYFTPYYLMF